MAFISTFFMAYTIYIFWDASPFVKICSSMRDGDIFFLDEPNVMHNGSDYYIADLVLDDDTVKITFTSVLKLVCFRGNHVSKFSKCAKYVLILDYL